MAAEESAAARGWRIAGASVRGVSHHADGRPNQDALAMWPAAGRSAPAAVVAIADGHGGARHCRSATGSRIAVDVTVATLRAIASTLDAASESQRSLVAAVEVPQRIVAAWNDAARAHLAADPIRDDEWRAMETAEGRAAVEAVRADPLLAYGATLLAVLATERCILVTQLGDGDVLAVAADGTTTRPVPADERLSGNLTTSICRAGAEADFRGVALSIRDAPPALVLLSTDGYANSFRSDADFLQVGRDFLDLIAKSGVAAVAAELPAILDHASQNGSGDDITLGLLRCAPPAPHAALADRGKAAHEERDGHAGRAEIARLDARLREAEGRIGGLRRTVALACLVALAAVGWSLRHQIASLLPATASGDVAAVPPRKAAPEPTRPPTGQPVGSEGDEKGKPIAVPESITPVPAATSEPQGAAGSLAIPPLIEELAAVRGERSVVVKALLVFPGAEPGSCAAEATVWDGKAQKLGSATTKVPSVRNKLPASVQVEIVVPFADAKRATAMNKDAAAFSVALTCDGHRVAVSDRQALRG